MGHDPRPLCEGQESCECLTTSPGLYPCFRRCLVFGPLPLLGLTPNLCHRGGTNPSFTSLLGSEMFQAQSSTLQTSRPPGCVPDLPTPTLPTHLLFDPKRTSFTFNTFEVVPRLANKWIDLLSTPYSTSVVVCSPPCTPHLSLPPTSNHYLTHRKSFGRGSGGLPSGFYLAVFRVMVPFFRMSKLYASHSVSVLLVMGYRVTPGLRIYGKKYSLLPYPPYLHLPKIPLTLLTWVLRL